MAFQEVFGIGALFTFKNVAGSEIRRARADVAKLKAEINGMKEYNIGVSKAITTAASGIKYFFGGAAAFFGPMFLAAHAGKFEEKMLYIKQATTASTAEMEKYRDVSLKAAQTTKFGMSEAAEGIYQVASAGYTGQQASTMLGTMLNFATVSGGELGQTIRDVTSVMHQYRVKAENANKVTSVMIKLQDLTAFNFNEIGGAMSTVGMSAAGAQQHLPVIAAYLGAYKNLGVGARDAGQKVKTALEFMKGARSSKALKDLGVSFFDVKTGQYKNMITFMGEFDAAVKKKGYNLDQINKAVKIIWGGKSNLYQAFKGAEANTTVNGKAVTLRGKEALDWYQAQYEEAQKADLAAERAAEHMKLLNNQLLNLKGSASALFTLLGGGAEDPTVAFVKSLHDTVVNITSWVKENPKLVKQIMSFTMVAGKWLMYLGLLKFGLGAGQFVLAIPTGVMAQWGNIAGTFKGMGAAGSAIGSGIKFAASQSTGLFGTLKAIANVPLPAICTAGVFAAAIAALSYMVYLMVQLNDEAAAAAGAQRQSELSQERFRAKMANKYGLTGNASAAGALAAGVGAASRGKGKLASGHSNKQGDTAVAMAAMAAYLDQDLKSRFPDTDIGISYDKASGGLKGVFKGSNKVAAESYFEETRKGITMKNLETMMAHGPNVTINLVLDGQVIQSVNTKSSQTAAERAGVVNCHTSGATPRLPTTMTMVPSH